MVESTRTTAAPVARRTRSAGWRDPRIIGGLVLMAICVLAGGWALDSRADDATVLVLNRDLAAGATIGRADVDVRKVHLAGDVAARYFGSVGDLPGDARLAHAVGSGNLLPRSALDRDEDAARVEVPLAVGHEEPPTPKIARWMSPPANPMIAPWA